MQEMLNRDKLDYSNVIFIQLDRINNLFSQVEINERRGEIVAENTSKLFSAIKSLDLMIKYKIPEKIREEYEKEKQEKYINKLNIWTYGIEMNVCCQYLDLVMKYIFKTNLLPKERTSYQTGDD
jgi:hypothetical protein